MKSKENKHMQKVFQAYLHIFFRKQSPEAKSFNVGVTSALALDLMDY